MDGLTAPPPHAGQRAADTLFGALLATVVMLFAGFTSAYWIRRTGSDWAALELPTWVLANSVTLFGASAALEAARRGLGRPWTALALVLGLAFLAGQVAAFASLAEGAAQVWSRPQGAFFFLLASVHGLHLLGGIVALAWLLRRGSPPRLVAWYWHFLALVWVYLVVLLRLP